MRREAALRGRMQMTRCLRSRPPSGHARGEKQQEAPQRRTVRRRRWTARDASGMDHYDLRKGYFPSAPRRGSAPHYRRFITCR